MSINGRSAPSYAIVPALSVFCVVIFGFYFGALVGTPFYFAAFFSAFAIAVSGMFIILLCIKIFWEGQPGEEGGVNLGC